MSLEAALERVTRLGGADARPVVDPQTVQAIVVSFPIADAEGREPGDASWEPTYDTNAATAEVWSTKAARVAGDFTFTADDATYNKGDVLAQCLAMEAKYAAMAGGPTGRGRGNAGTVAVTSSVFGYPDDWLYRDDREWDGGLIP